MCALMCVTSSGENFWDQLISRLMFGHRVSWYIETSSKTELSQGEKYEARVIARWTDLFNGRHFARLKEHKSQPRAILRWDPAPTSADRDPGLASEISNIRNHSQTLEAVQVRKGDSLFGFRCIDVYTQADWCRAFPVFKNFWARPKGEKDHRHLPWERTSSEVHMEEEYQRQVIASQARRHGSTGRECTFEPVDLNRWALASSAWQKYRPTPQQHDRFAERTSAPRLYDGIHRRTGNWPKTSFAFLDGYATFDIRLLTFSIATGLYGGLHLLAWEALFGSSVEQFLWRASCLLLAMSGCIITSAVPVRLTTTLLGFISELLDESSSGAELCWLFYLGFGATILLPVCAIMHICALAYIPARIFLIVESCIQLGRLPPGAYLTPDWSKYYPHISWRTYFLSLALTRNLMS